MKKTFALLVVMVMTSSLPSFTVMASNGVKDLEVIQKNKGELLKRSSP